MSVSFSSSAHGIIVSRRPDGSYSWSGHYSGMVIKSVVPIDCGKRCVLLLDPDANQRSAFENLLCIDEQGSVIWKAKLPTGTDAFVGIDSRNEGIWANTWSGYRVLIDEHSGKELTRTFVK